ncbi:hypothetical protein J3Q64DRAFT_1880472 [Phycomyces blakesleeanus]|uniref:Palmitoyltransferase n=2 Tax=Phycomyces blakesleeanus TaxID=4837 RepID=A0A162PWW6_PHYB8|nr:hypothetical protein PHYBLDRAFT_167263 [Phycomyces blakesleeanus NRRL 1555(-)]OAD74926.1 hypothetical protein PHYBLDRAFT_167263 [Phycomyces blakesleeanus NRRL 1555(-)]|eukprot:XP_018292966.1 hypothetical protein PHYBLDRAFT_167263 [Phycomyces blakesleeanus NRRL 1555(-)]
MLLYIIPRNLDKMPLIASSINENSGIPPDPLQCMTPPIKIVMIKGLHVQAIAETVKIVLGSAFSLRSSLYLAQQLYRKKKLSHIFVFIVTGAFLSLSVFAFSLAHLMLLYFNDPEQPEFKILAKYAPVSLLLTIFSFLLIFPIGYLTEFHYYIICAGVTTHEKLKLNSCCLSPKVKELHGRQKFVTHPLPLQTISMTTYLADNRYSTISPTL